MPNICFVTGCRTGYSSAVREQKALGIKSPSLFKVPNDKRMLEKWKRSIPRKDKELTSKDFVCELHFEPSLICRTFETLIFDGSVSIIDRVNPALKNNAVPTIFPETSFCLTRNQRKSNNLTTRGKANKKSKMGENQCSVASCNSNSNIAESTGENLMFFSFPKDPIIRQGWIIKCNRKDTFNPDTARVCSKHFVKDDFEDALSSVLSNMPPKKLKPTALPSLYLSPTKWKEIASEIKFQFSQENNLKTAKKNLIPPDLQPCEENNHKTTPKDNPFTRPLVQVKEEPMDESPSQSEVVSVSNLVENSRLPERILALENIKEDLLEKNFKLVKIVEIFKEKLQTERDKIHQLIQQNNLLQFELNLAKQKRTLDEEIKNTFQGVLTPNQIDIMLKKKVKVHWSEEELNNAQTLRSLSEDSYQFVRNNLHYPLPALSTLKGYASKEKFPKNSEKLECIMKFEVEDPEEEEELIIKKDELIIKKEIP